MNTPLQSKFYDLAAIFALQSQQQESDGKNIFFAVKFYTVSEFYPYQQQIQGNQNRTSKRNRQRGAIGSLTPCLIEHFLRLTSLHSHQIERMGHSSLASIKED